MNEKSQIASKDGTGVMAFFQNHIFQILALGVLIVAIMGAGKASAMLALKSIVRFVWPFLLLWIVWRWVKAKFANKMKGFQEQIMEAARQQQAQRSGGGKGDVIDLCPKCGSVLGASHKCR